MPNLKRVTAVLAVAAAALAAAPSALAGTASYNSTGPFFVSDDSTTTSTITVPQGRTPVQSVEVTNFTVFWPASAQELSTQIVGTDGTFMNLFEIGCFSYAPADVYVFSDSAAQSAPDAKDDPKCDLGGGAFRPVDPANRKLSIFSGKEASGTWTLRATDNGVTFNNQGSIQTWALRIVHAPPTLTATGPNSAKAGSKLTLSAKSNADGTVVTGGGANRGTTRLDAGKTASVPYTVTKKVRKTIKKKGKARVTISLDFTDETGGTDAASVSVTLKGKKK